MDFELPVLAPSILAADFTRLGTQVSEAIEGGAEWIHCDIMDGHFVPNISFGPEVVKQVRAIAGDAFVDVHLMIEHPDKYIEEFVNAGADMITVHVEAAKHLHRTLQQIKNYGLMAGVAINPGTSLSSLDAVYEYVDMVLAMSVNPGFGGQSYIEATQERVQKLTEIRAEGDYTFLIQIDGGVNMKNITKIMSAGTDVLVAGTAVFKAEDVPARVREINKLLKG